MNGDHRREIAKKIQLYLASRTVREGYLICESGVILDYIQGGIPFEELAARLPGTSAVTGSLDSFVLLFGSRSEQIRALVEAHGGTVKMIHFSVHEDGE